MATDIKSINKEKIFFIIPQSLIINSKLPPERIAIYCRLRKDSVITPVVQSFDWLTWIGDCNKPEIKYNSQVQYDCSSICRWLGRNPLSRSRKNNCYKRVIETIEAFINNKIIENPKRIKYNLFKANFNELPTEVHFAKIFLDEIDKIIHYQSDKYTDKYKPINKANVMLVLAYLRLRIPINNVSTDYIEAFDCFYRDIATDIGIGDDAVQKAIFVLNDLGIIYSEDYEYISGRFNLVTHIFSNVYKRDTINGVLIASGEDYYKKNINKQKSKLKKMYKALLERCILKAGGGTNETST